MSQFEKLFDKLKRRPKDFSYDELKYVLTKLGYSESSKGKTSGSAVGFTKNNSKRVLCLHKPHPTSKNVPIWDIDRVIKFLKEEGDI